MSDGKFQDPGVDPEAVAAPGPGDKAAPPDGVFGRSAPIGESLGRGGVERLSRKFYADVHWRKDHVVVADGIVKRFRKLGDIPAQAGDELYVDAMLPSRFQEFEELLNRGVRVFYLRRTDVLEKYREKKSDEDDARALMRIPQHLFRELIGKELEVRRLLHKYTTTKSHMELVKQLSREADDEETRAHYRHLINHLRRRKYKLAKEIDALARNFLPVQQIAWKLGIISNNCLFGRVALVQLLLYVDFSLGLRKILTYTGNYYPNDGRYSRTLKDATESLTISVKRRQKIKGKEVREVLKTIKNVLKAMKR